MRYTLIRSVLCVVLFSFGQTLLTGQDAERLRSSAYDNLALEDVLSSLENLYDIDIYFKPSAELGRLMTISFEDQTVEQVLEELLGSSTLSYIPYREYAYVIAPRSVIDRSYSSDFYTALESSITDDGEDEEKLVIGDIESLDPSGLASIRGVVVDAQTGEAVIGATILIEELSNGTTSDIDGSYQLDNVPAGQHEIKIGYIGYTDIYQVIDLRSTGSLDVNLFKSDIQLSEVTIRARAADASVNQVQIGVATMDIKDIKKLPTFLGEVDVIKSFLLQPGVSTVGEGASGFNVRGGNVDQNLILQDETILFNSSHALGFFSTFNSDLIRKVDLYKANVPAQFGGRLVSVLDVEMRDGDYERFRFKAGIGPISSKIAMEGPIIKDKVTFVGGFRSSYTDWLLGQISNVEVQRSSAFFYDGNIRITAKPSDNHTFIFSGYISEDDFSFNEEFGFDYGTKSGELTYRALLNDKMINTLSVVASTYESSQLDLDGFDGARIDNNIDYIKVKNNFKVVPREGIELNLGVSTIDYTVDPGIRTPIGENSVIRPITIEEERGRESAVYADVSYALTDALQVTGGGRFSFYQFRGPHDEFQYEDPLNPTNQNIGEVIRKTGTVASFSNIEPRVSLRYTLGDDSSVKAGYSRTAQYINQIFNTDSPTPSSQWQLSTRYIRPPTSQNVSVGYFKNFSDNTWETSFEIYGRKIDDQFDYIDFATLLINDHLETDLLFGEGRAFGAELSIKKNVGALTGWLAYTYSRSERRIDGINDGEWYFSNFDKTHDASLILNYNPNQRNTLTMNVTYSTGRPTTPPLGNIITPDNIVIPLFSERNSSRIPDFFRVDLSYTIGQSYKKEKAFRTSWTIAVFNVLGRRNPFSVFFTRAPFERVQANRLAIIGAAFPSLTVNIELQ